MGLYKVGRGLIDLTFNHPASSGTLGPRMPSIFCPMYEIDVCKSVSVAELPRRQEGETQKVARGRRKERVDVANMLLPELLPSNPPHLSETRRATFGTHPCHQRSISRETTPPLRTSPSPHTYLSRRLISHTATSIHTNRQAHPHRHQPKERQLHQTTKKLQQWS